MSEIIACPKCGSDKTWRQGFKHGRRIIQCKVCRKYSVIPNVGEPVVPAPKPLGIITLAMVKDRYDVVSAIRREVSAITKGQLIPEAEVCQRAAGRDRYRFRRAIENRVDEFRAFRVKLRIDEGEPKWYWGSAEDVAKAIEIRDE